MLESDGCGSGMAATSSALLTFQSELIRSFSLLPMTTCDAGAILQRRDNCRLQASFLRRFSGRASDDVNASLEGTKEVS